MAGIGDTDVSITCMGEDVLQRHGRRFSDSELAFRDIEDDLTRRNDATRWLRKTVGVVLARDLPAEPSEEDFKLGLRSGVILCNVLNKIQAGAVPKVVEPDVAARSAFQYNENVKNFLAAIEEMGLPTFEASDLEQGGNSSRVVDCVLALKSYGGRKIGGSVSRRFSGGLKSSVRKNSEPFVNPISRSHSVGSDRPLDTLDQRDLQGDISEVFIECHSRPLYMLLSDLLANKEEEAIPFIIENILNKVTEEFENRLANQVKKASLVTSHMTKDDNGLYTSEPFRTRYEDRKPWYSDVNKEEKTSLETKKDDQNGTEDGKATRQHDSNREDNEQQEHNIREDTKATKQQQHNIREEGNKATKQQEQIMREEGNKATKQQEQIKREEGNKATKQQEQIIREEGNKATKQQEQNIREDYKAQKLQERSNRDDDKATKQQECNIREDDKATKHQERSNKEDGKATKHQERNNKEQLKTTKQQERSHKEDGKAVRPQERVYKEVDKATKQQEGSNREVGKATKQQEGSNKENDEATKQQECINKEDDEARKQQERIKKEEDEARKQQERIKKEEDEAAKQQARKRREAAKARKEQERKKREAAKAIKEQERKKRQDEKARMEQERRERKARREQERRERRARREQKLKEKARKQQERIRKQEEYNKLKEKMAKRLVLVEQQHNELQELRSVVSTAKSDMKSLQTNYHEEFSNLGNHSRSLTQAAAGYKKVLEENRKLYNQVQDLRGSSRVYCRVRPFLPGDENHLTSVDYIDDGNITIITPSKAGREGRKSFTFNRVFGPSATQEEVFSDTQPLIRSVLDGFNICIFAYGQTGAGKTYTMNGPDDLTPETMGVNYRALDDLFLISEQRKNLTAYEISINMLEIYNEQIRDLLVTDGTNKILDICSGSKKGINVPDANLMPVTSTNEVIDLMNLAHKNRAVGSTPMNDHSSRSHSCLIVHVFGKDLTSRTTVRGCMHLVDLAGSERIDNLEGADDTLKESTHINKSLSALGDVIVALAHKSSRVPYKNSKLTQLLQDALGGQAKTLIFVHICPDADEIGETLNTLKFAERVSAADLGGKSGKDAADARELKDQIASLKAALARKDGDSQESSTNSPRAGKESGLGDSYPEANGTDESDDRDASLKLKNPKEKGSQSRSPKAKKQPTSALAPAKTAKPQPSVDPKKRRGK